MIGELLYHLHKHVRVALIAGGLMLALGLAAAGYGLTRHAPEASARPATAERMPLSCAACGLMALSKASGPSISAPEI